VLFCAARVYSQTHKIRESVGNGLLHLLGM
jgi:hypothetical protein